MKTLLLFAALAAIGVAWSLNRMTAANLRAELGALRLGSSELADARREHDRLRQLQAEAAQRAQERRDAPPPVAPAAKTVTPSPASLVLGEWRAPASWQNRGRATPAATIETALWAAAGGDLVALQNLLHLDDTVRTKIATLHARLPYASRVLYPSAEHLLAAFATKSLPLGDAQLVWNHQPNAEEAFACLFVKNPDFVPTASPAQPPMPATREEAIARAAALKEARAKDKRPPAAPANEATRALYLVLRSTDAGWRLVVSPGAVDKIAKELGGPR